jgi:toxin secretion/phage lysis holin
MTVLFYISNEGISILENLGKLDIKYPQKLKDILEQLEDKDEHKDDTKSDN